MLPGSPQGSLEERGRAPCPPNHHCFAVTLRTIWDAAVAAVRADDLVANTLADVRGPLHRALAGPGRILVVGAGKAGAAMSLGVERALAEQAGRVHGSVNVPAGNLPSLQNIRLHPARPSGTNQPTAAGVAGTQHILELLATAGLQDVALCLLSGGGSALLPAPAAGVTLEDKQEVTKLLHACGATINEMNCVRKHLSNSKGGRLAQAFRGRELFSLIISDVIGDPLDVIASGPTAADPTTFADALAVLETFGLTGRVPKTVLHHLERGRAGEVSETLKVLPGNVHNQILGNNVLALAAASRTAQDLGYPILNFGSFLEGETRQVAMVFAGLVRSIRTQGVPIPAPVCLLSGGETTVTLPDNHGLGGAQPGVCAGGRSSPGGTGIAQPGHSQRRHRRRGWPDGCSGGPGRSGNSSHGTRPGPRSGRFPGSP